MSVLVDTIVCKEVVPSNKSHFPYIWKSAAIMVIWIDIIPWQLWELNNILCSIACVETMFLLNVSIVMCARIGGQIICSWHISQCRLWLRFVKYCWKMCNFRRGFGWLLLTAWVVELYFNWNAFQISNLHI